MTTPPPRGRRDCQCARVRHQHGSEAGYTKDGCRCLPCALARQRYVAALRAGMAPPERRTATIHGTRRRLQALTALGWSPPEIAARAGGNPEVIRRLRSDDASSPRYRDDATVLLATRDTIAEIYDALWHTPSTGPKAGRMRNLAAAHGWPPPLAWDDDEIDDPCAQPHRPTGGSWDLAPCGTTAAARRHHRRAEPLDEACKAAERRARAERSAA